ncbi:hypothetical protein BMS3Abin17_01243 [archaeon BMS3Abin17]|nr:hypothetical protein BMS3Abin17_01243 [archaeon BMS3Abin17]HDZ60701.1 hypothetical protein [Candidatus Pacearchaeota archaeon]
MNNKEWLEKKYFHLGCGRVDRLISAKKILKLMKDYFSSEFDCLMFNNFLKSGNYPSRGEQVSRILKEFADRGFLKSKNTLSDSDCNGRKKARYIYEISNGGISK